MIGHMYGSIEYFTKVWELNAKWMINIWNECSEIFLLNPLRAKFLRENINIYLHFMSFLHTNKTHVVEIPPRVRQGPAYST